LNSELLGYGLAPTAPNAGGKMISLAGHVYPVFPLSLVKASLSDLDFSPSVQEAELGIEIPSDLFVVLDVLPQDLFVDANGHPNL